MSGEVAYLLERVARADSGQGSAEPPTERARFEAMVRRQHAKLRRFTAAMIADQARVDDVLQEAYIKAFRRLPRSFANEAHESAWLYRVVYRCSVDELRRARRMPEATEIVDVGSSGDALARTLADDAWRSLSDRDRAVLLVVDIAGFDYAAAGHLLRIPRGTVASRLSAARERLRQRVTDV